MWTCFFDIEPELHGHAGVDFRGALFAVPVPVACFDGLPAPPALGPSAVEAEVHAIVFRVAGVGARPDEVASGFFGVEGKFEHGHFTRFFGEVFAFDELVRMGLAGIGKNLDVFSGTRAGKL